MHPPLRLAPGPGWGDGTHPTTRLCLQAIEHLVPGGALTALDFGSGSGILSIALAGKGALVDGIEIDPAAIAHAEENARQNGVCERIQFSRELSSEKRYAVVVANILRPVLMDHAEALAKRLMPRGLLMLSGLVSTDIPEILVRYGGLLKSPEPRIFSRDEWRLLIWGPELIRSDCY